MKMLRFLLPCLLLLTVSAVHAQRGFMKVLDPNQVPGESLQQGFLQWTEISAFNAGSTTVLSAGSNPSPSRPDTKCFTISMNQDKVAYWFKKEMYQGTNIASIQFDFVKTTGAQNQETYYRVYMENVLVTAIEEAVDSDGASYMNVSFVPRKFRYTYWPQNSNGQLGTPVLFGWDNAINQAW